MGPGNLNTGWSRVHSFIHLLHWGNIQFCAGSVLSVNGYKKKQQRLCPFRLPHDTEPTRVQSQSIPKLDFPVSSPGLCLWLPFTLRPDQAISRDISPVWKEYRTSALYLLGTGHLPWPQSHTMCSIVSLQIGQKRGGGNPIIGVSAIRRYRLYQMVPVYRSQRSTPKSHLYIS